MQVIGAIIKETAKHSVRRLKTSHASNSKIVEQQKVLHHLVEKAKMTSFGIQHNFDKIAKSRISEVLFDNNVPLTNYELFHETWLSRSLAGESYVTWPGKIDYFALTSGTTSNSSKRIPVSDDMLREFHRISLQQILDVSHLDLPLSFYDSRLLIVGGSTDLTQANNHLEGDLSGILNKKKSFAFSPFTKPNNKISKMKEWDVKMQAIIEKAPKWNIGAIAGLPSWVSVLLENIIKEYQLKDIHEIWPNLKIYTHGGIFLEPYKEKLEKCFGKKVHYQNTYLASEGYFGFQRNLNENGLSLLTNKGVYYEFIEEKDFDKVKKGDLQNINTLNLSEVKTGVNYGLVISTCSGLWRYILGDIIQFQNTDEFQFIINGRINNSLNIMGEHLSEKNMIRAVRETSKKLGVKIEAFCVYSSKYKDRHNWYLGSNQKVDSNKFAVHLNEQLSLLNDDYAYLRAYLLKAPKVKTVPLDKFYEYMAYHNRSGGQNKFPRVMTAKQAANWERFLTRTDI